LEAVNLMTVNTEEVVLYSGETGGDNEDIGYLVIVKRLETKFITVCQEIRHWLGARARQSWDDTVCSVCSTQCMPYSAYSVLSVCWS
jgi:hypothetical protein